ncbi:MAG TPA: hypothetical protein VEV17_11240 [Bryobacteraceae bacterium]|nr:hypothetical protein [Bryobacteraceae bacterium]
MSDRLLSRKRAQRNAVAALFLSHREAAASCALVSGFALAALIALPVAGQSPAVAAKAAGGAAKTGNWVASKTPDGQPDLQGIWNNGTVTPMERPAELAGKEFFTEKEALAWEKQVLARTNRDQRAPGTVQDVARAYNDIWWDSGTRVVRTLRTSMVIDPPDGRIPPLTLQAQEAQRARAELRQHPAETPRDRMLAERCLQFPTSGPPMTPYVYNNNFRIVQTKDYVAINIELLHDVRMIPLDGRAHLPSNIRLWFGDSIGHWEANTLVVDTTNFTNKTSFRGSDQNLHVIERFTRIDPETIVYRFTIDDPTAFTKPWTAELTMVKSPGPIYEYDCHEGNYGMMNLLKGARAEEKAAAEGNQK